MSKKSESERKVLTVTEAGRQLGLGRNASYEAVARGEIPALRFGRRLLVPKAAFDRMLEQWPEAEADRAERLARESEAL